MKEMKQMKAEMKVVVLKNEIVTTSGCFCFEYGVMNADTANDDCD